MNDFDQEQEQRRQAEATRRQEERREQAAALEKQRLEQKHKAQSAELARQARHREASAKLARDERERFKTVEARASAIEKLVVAANKGQESRTLDPRGQPQPAPAPPSPDAAAKTLDGLTVEAVLAAQVVDRAARNSRERQEQRIDRALDSMPPDRRLEAENRTRAEALAADLKRKQEGDRQRQPIANARMEREPERKTPESRPTSSPDEPGRQDYRQQARELAQKTGDYQHPEVQALRQKAQEAERAQPNSLKASVDPGRGHTQHQPSVDVVQTGVAQAPTVGRSR